MLIELLAISLLAWLLLAETVKERPDAVPCARCSKPTWSRTGLCHACRVGVPPGPPAPEGTKDELGRVVIDACCMSCRRELRGLAADGKCPNCGSSIARSLVSAWRPEDQVVIADVALDAEGRLAEEIPCVGCGYALQGLRPEGPCPECGAAIERSLKGDYLRFADRGWLRRMTLGLWLILGGVGGQIVVNLLLDLLLSPFIGVVWRDLALGLSVSATSVASIVMAIGVWFLTTPEPARSERERRWSARRVARLCMLAQAASVPLETAATSAGSSLVASGQTLITVRLAMLGAAFVLAIIGIVGCAAGLIYLRQLASRIPRARLARETTTVLRGLVTIMVVALSLFVPAVPAAVQSGGSLLVPGGSGAGMMICGIAVVLIVFVIWAIILLIRYALAFKQAAEERGGR